MQVAIYVPRKAEDNPEKLKAVMSEMKRLGPPKIRALWAEDCWIAIEGSHRVAAAQKLGLPVTILEMDADDEISNHDLEGLPRHATVFEMADYVGETGFAAYIVETIDKQEFIEAYTEVFALWLSYDSKSIGARVYAQKLVDMHESHPEWAEEAENMGDDPIDMSA